MPTRPGSRGSSAATLPGTRVVQGNRPHACGTLARAGRAARYRRAPCRALRRCRRRSGACRGAISAPSADFDATYHLRLGDVGHTWEVRCTTHGARVRSGVTGRRPDVVIGTDAETWLALRRGDLSGIEAFSQRRLYARGDLDLAVGFEGMFRLPNGRPPLLRIHDVERARQPDLDPDHGRGPRRPAAARPRRRPSRRSSTPRPRSAAATGSTRSTSRASAARASPRWPATARRSSPARCSA